MEGIDLNYVSGSRYLGGFLGPQDQLDAWVKPQVEAHGVRVLVKIARGHPQSAEARLGMLFQIEWQYLQKTVPGVRTLMCPVEVALRDKFFLAVFGGGRSTPTF